MIPDVSLFRRPLILAGCLLVSLAACSDTSGTLFEAPIPETPALTQAAPQAEIAGFDTGETARPALWSVRDEDTEIFLFGTVHVLKPGIDWQSPALTEALGQADAVYMEADVTSPEVIQALSGAVMQFGMFQDGRTLTGVLTDEQEAIIAPVSESLGLPLMGLDSFKPWFAAISLTELFSQKLGYSGELGVEMTLMAEASALNIEMRYLETALEQIEMFATVPEADEIALLVQTARQISEEPDMLDTIVAAWAKGDVEGIAAIMASEEAFGSEFLTEMLLTKRNKNWTEQIIALMEDEAGTFLMAVGAAHLAGDDSVQAMLAQQGVTITRMP